MDVFRQLEAQGLEQLDVEGQGGQPLIAPDYMGGAHQVVIHGVGEVIGGNAVGFQQHVVHVVLRNGQLALYQVVKFELVLNGARRAEAEHPGIAGGQLGLDFLHAPVPPDGVRAIVAGGFLVGLLLFPHGGQLLFRAEAGVGLALGDQLLGIHMVNICPLALPVGAVAAVVAVDGSALVKVNVVVLQRFNQNLHSPGNLPLGIGVLHAKKQNAI